MIWPVSKPESCGDVITDRNDEHATYECALPVGHRSAHATLDERCVWTDSEHYGEWRRGDGK